MHRDDIIPLGFCQCGCGQRTGIVVGNDATRGEVRGQPRRFCRGHNNKRPIVDPSRYRVDPDTGCWVWLGSHGTTGYGKVEINYQGVGAHRVYYESLVGPIPEGLELDHLCRNRACVNPAHLEPVSRAVNTQRGAMARLTPANVREIRALRGVITQAQIAERFGVCSRTIWEIHNGRIWKNV